MGFGPGRAAIEQHPAGALHGLAGHRRVQDGRGLHRQAQGAEAGGQGGDPGVDPGQYGLHCGVSMSVVERAKPG